MIKQFYKKVKNVFAKKAETIVKPDMTQSGIVIYSGDSLFNGDNPDANLSDYAQMRHDEQVSVCLEVRLLAMIAKGYEITVPEGQEKLQKEIESVLNNLTGSFYQTAKQIELVKKVFGFSASEIIWNLQDGKYIPVQIKTLNSQKIKFYPDKFGDLPADGLRQDTDLGIINLPSEKFILHINNFEFGNYFGVSELKSGYSPYLDKTKLTVLYNTLLERFGIPPIIAKYDPMILTRDSNGNLTSSAKAELQNVVNAVKKTHQGGVILVANTFEHEVLKLDAASGQAFENALDRLDLRITKSLKLPSELGFLNVKVGSNAKAETQLDLFLMIVDQDKAELEETINEQLIRRYCLYNYGVMDEYPKLKFNPTTSDDVHLIIKSYNESIKAGSVRATSDAEEKILKMLNLPEVNEANIIETKPQPEDQETPGMPEALTA